MNKMIISELYIQILIDDIKWLSPFQLASLSVERFLWLLSIDLFVDHSLFNSC